MSPTISHYFPGLYTIREAYHHDLMAVPYPGIIPWRYSPVFRFVAKRVEKRKILALNSAYYESKLIWRDICFRVSYCPNVYLVGCCILYSQSLCILSKCTYLVCIWSFQKYCIFCMHHCRSFNIISPIPDFWLARIFFSVLLLVDKNTALRGDIH